MDAFYSKIVEEIKNKIMPVTLEFEDRCHLSQEQTLIVSPEKIDNIMSVLKLNFGFNFMIDLCGVDWPER